MPANNKSAYPFLIIAGTMICLLALSFVHNSFSFQGFTSRQVDMLADLKVTPPPPAPPHRKVTLAKNQPADSLATDSIVAEPARPVYDFMTYTGIQEYTDTVAVAAPGMQHFLQALQELKSGKRKKVRIAYFGDSMIEGDLITSDLRDSLQTQFGGAGVGFVPVTSVVASFRATILHTFSDNWKDYHFRNNPPQDLSLGLSGHAFIPATESWARYSPVHRHGLDRFSQVYLFYGPGNSHVLINGKPYTLSGAEPLNELAFRQDTTQRSVLLKYTDGTPQPFYGLSFESDNGVYVDNFSFRGISGIELAKLRRGMLQQMQRRHPYDLVVLHYGANVLFRPELTDYSWYERPMQRVIDSLRSNWPHTSFLIVGTADKSYKKTDHYITAPGVTALLKVQHELAEQHGAAYWNLYAAMGGENSMRHWVEGDTVLANKDYTHFNSKGAARVGALLYKAIMDEYRQEEDTAAHH